MTLERLETAVVLVRGADRNNFGTAFAIHRDATGTYLLTCAHVLDDLGPGEHLKIRDYPVTVLARGSKESFDLAVLHVTGLLEYPILASCVEDLGSGSQFTAGGFYALSDQRVAETFDGILEKTIRVESLDQGSVLGWYLSLNPGSNLQRGNSGAPVVHRETGFVVGIITHRLGESRGVALSLEALGKVWPEAPPGLLDTPQGLAKQNLLLELLQDLPLHVPEVPELERLNQIRNALLAKELLGKNAFDRTASFIAEVIAKLRLLSHSAANHVAELKKDLVVAEAPIRELRTSAASSLEKIAIRDEERLAEIRGEIERFFNRELVEKAKIICTNYMEENPLPPFFFTKRALETYSSKLFEVVYSRISVILENWRREHLLKSLLDAQERFEQASVALIEQFAREVRRLNPRLSTKYEDDLFETLVGAASRLSNRLSLPVSEAYFSSHIRVSLEDLVPTLSLSYFMVISLLNARSQIIKELANTVENSIKDAGANAARDLSLILHERQVLIEQATRQVTFACARVRESSKVPGIETQIATENKSLTDITEWLERLVKIGERLV